MRGRGMEDFELDKELGMLVYYLDRIYFHLVPL